MKLLYITEDRYPPFRADVVELFAKQMPARGHQVDWLMQRGERNDGDFSDEVVWLGNKVFLTSRSEKKGFLGRIFNNVLGVIGDVKVFRLASKEKYDVIQVRDKFLASIYAIIASRLNGTKFVYWMSYPFPESKIYLAKNRQTKYPVILLLKGYVLKFILYKIILPNADYIFVQSEQMKNDVAVEGVPLDKMKSVPMGIRADQVSNEAPTSSKKLNTNRPVLLCLGSILRLRQSEMLVRVLKRVREKYPGARLIYVGEGQNPEDRLAVENECQQHGLEDAVTITGFLPMDDAWKYVEQADICFSPFYPIPVLLSTSPTKLIEYMAMAKVIVANEHPEQHQVLSDSGVGKCVPWNEQAFADEVCRILDAPEDSAARAARGPEWVRVHRTYDVIADDVNDQYQKIIG